MHSLKVCPVRLGDDITLIGASPTPGTDTITNWPGVWPRFWPPGSRTVKIFSSAVSVWISSMVAMVGRKIEVCPLYARGVVVVVRLDIIGHLASIHPIRLSFRRAGR